jgi:branched-chain amino acid transport system substrate-binding protein
VLASIIADDGNDTVAIIARNDAYGTGLAEDLTSNLEAAGVQVVVTKVYDEKAGPADTDIDALKAANPAAIAVIGFDESSKILASMVEKGIGPKDLNVYGVDGNTGNALGDNFDAGK